MGKKSSKKKSRRRRPKQLSLSARMRGGWRAAAGRRRSRGGRVAHRRRPTLSRHHPVHVTLRVRDDYPRLRQPRALRWIRQAIQQGHKQWCRVVQFSVLSNHLHLLVEADDQESLARGMQGLKVRLARRLNLLFKLRGTVFPERYHERQIRTPTEARNGLGYVLNNYRRHAKQHGRTPASGWVDPYSSATSFDGWGEDTVTSEGYETEAVTRAPQTWLLRAGWRRRGLLDPSLVPGPLE